MTYSPFMVRLSLMHCKGRSLQTSSFPHTLQVTRQPVDGPSQSSCFLPALEIWRDANA